MKKIILFDTSVGSLNQGDNIIMKSIRRNISDILENNFVVTMPTHTPCFYPFQTISRNKRYVFTKNCDYKFICGTNLINRTQFSPRPNWNAYSFNCREYKNSVLLGVGQSGIDDSLKVEKSTERLLNKALSRNYIHSTRDEKTKLILEKLGFRAINTGCPTMWGLTNDFCAQINKEKSDSVIFTLTNYAPDKTDQLLVDKLLMNYEKVYFYPQGEGDYKYINSLKNVDKIKIISPDIEAYSDFLRLNQPDYVGTRLHGGVYAMQHKCRSIIISIDNRTTDMRNNYNINCINREEIEGIDSRINSSFETKINIDIDKINQWKSQFI